jgi:hypothetical protein
MWTVRAPLFENAEHLNLSYSARVGGGAHAIDDLDVDALKTGLLH